MRSRDQPVSMTVSKANTADKIVSVQFSFHFHMEGSASLLRARNFRRRPGQQSIRWRKRMRCKKMSRISGSLTLTITWICKLSSLFVYRDDLKAKNYKVKESTAPAISERENIEIKNVHKRRFLMWIIRLLTNTGATLMACCAEV